MVLLWGRCSIGGSGGGGSGEVGVLKPPPMVIVTTKFCIFLAGSYIILYKTFPKSCLLWCRGM